MNGEKRHWVAFVIGLNKEKMKTVASFIAFDAINKFEALRTVEKMLPESSNWVSSDGKLIEFSVVALEQSKPEEDNDRMQAFVEKFSAITGQEPDFEFYHSKP